MQTYPPVRQPGLVHVWLLAVAIIGVIFLFVQHWALPIHLALLASWFLVMGLGRWLGLDYASMQKGITTGIHHGMDAVLVLIAVGALIGTWMVGGIVPNIIYYGLSVMSPDWFLPGAFVICAITSLATGTSFGTIGTAGIAMMGIGAGFGIPLPIVAGAAICGAYVGDKLSPLSDTTVMTASLCEVGLVDHIKSMLTVSAPALLITFLLFLFAGWHYQGAGELNQAQQAMAVLEGSFSIGWVMLVPALVVVGLLAMRYPSVPVICLGALLGVVWAILFQQQPLVEAISSLYGGNRVEEGLGLLSSLLNRGGMASMFEVIILVLLALGLGGLMEVTGVLGTIANRLQRWAHTPGRLGVSTLFAGFLGNFLGGAAYVSLITASTITRTNYEAMGIDRRVLSRNTEAGGTITTPMVPWSDGGVFMAGTLGVATMTYLPYLWYHFLVLALSVIYGFAGIAMWRTTETGGRTPSLD
ncbi:Na+/H+ antiporter NhaC [Bowmanella dokdonensis]|uniref:Na+/H+ antiporter NhaC n=1 Tax=Bowmanella dokdonensis TaxID=751969 RepID=A0A939IPT1_9ALTE|nr:Na+/H+ antiporter NhaC [Bowmanella dokdonensis]MBN7827758.1 Na+/H+ antiporter NhaC [Bowmanella dokdonensis]